MGLDNIQLSSKTIVELYKEALVELNERQTERTVETPTTLPMLGKNGRKISWVVNESGNAILPAAPLRFLQDVMQACRLTMDDVSILNVSHLPSATYTNWNAHLQSDTIILLGPTPAEVGVPLNFPQFQIQSHNKIRFLAAPALEELENDKLLKSKLWVCLKTLFNL